MIQLDAANRVPPAFGLNLNVCSGKKLVRLFHITIEINATITRLAGDRHFDESVAFHYNHEKILECGWVKLQ